MEPTGEITEFEVTPKGLVVDDDEQWQDTFVRQLTDFGLSTRVVSSLGAAEDLLDREFFHVALVDLSLVEGHNRDGLTILKKMYWELREGTAGILLTGFGGVEEGAKANSYGAEVIGKNHVSYSRMREAIHKATNDASNALARYKVGFNLLTGSGTPEEKQINEYKMLHVVGGGYERLDELVTRLLTNMYPVLRLKQAPNASPDEVRRLVSGTYWSKMLGSPVVLLLGDAESVENEVNNFRASHEDYADGSYQQLLKFEKDEEIAGAVFRVNAPDFSAFDRRHDPVFQAH